MDYKMISTDDHLSFHVVVFLGGRQNATPAPEDGKPASVFANTKLFMGQFLDPFVDLFAWGILERHPRLRLVMAESGLGLLPWIVSRSWTIVTGDCGRAGSIGNSVAASI